VFVDLHLRHRNGACLAARRFDVRAVVVVRAVGSVVTRYRDVWNRALRTSCSHSGVGTEETAPSSDGAFAEDRHFMGVFSLQQRHREAQSLFIVGTLPNGVVKRWPYAR
jgi:hypothetical protein